MSYVNSTKSSHVNIELSLFEEMAKRIVDGNQTLDDAELLMWQVKMEISRQIENPVEPVGGVDPNNQEIVGVMEGLVDVAYPWKGGDS
jgi:hypothetical protein